MTVVHNEIGVPIHGLDPQADPPRIAHVSDFHFRSWNRTVRETRDILLHHEFDLIAVTGDFVTRPWRWKNGADLTNRFFEPIAEKTPVYAVLGNHDNHKFKNAVQVPIRFLQNESVNIQTPSGTFELAGVDQSTPAEENLYQALNQKPRPDTTILLAHYPSTIYRLPPKRVHLQLSGHTHGGQIRLPWVGCVWPHDKIPREMARGLHSHEGTHVHVSPGIGCSPPLLMRVNCPPEVTTITLTTANTPTNTPRTAQRTAALA